MQNSQSRRIAAGLTALGFAAASLAFSAPASAYPTCPVEVSRMCEAHWQALGYASANECRAEEVKYCPQPGEGAPARPDPLLALEP